MGTTTFSGPIRSGTIRSTNGTIVGTDIANVGQVVLHQRAAITQAATSTAFTTSIIIPGSSLITAIKLYVVTAWSGAATTGGVGYDDGAVVAATALTAAGAVAGGTIGLISIGSGADATRISNWLNVGVGDKRINFVSTNTGNGVGVIEVEYVQAANIAARP